MEDFFNLKFLGFDAGGIVGSIYNFLFGWAVSGGGRATLSGGYVLLIIFSIIVFIVLVFVFLKLRSIETSEYKSYKKRLKEGIKKREENRQGKFTSQWEGVRAHVVSANINDWKLAIIDADAMLDLVLTEEGVEGDDLGGRLKNLTGVDADILDQAWEAHKLRNRIAHDGSELKLTQDDASRALAKFERVFRAFGYL